MINKGKYYINIPVTFILAILFTLNSYIINGFSINLIRDFILNVILILLSQSDLYKRKIPNIYILLLIILAILDIVLINQIPFLERVIWFIICAVTLLVLDLISNGGIGGGDIKLISVCAIFIGHNILLAVSLGSVMTLGWFIYLYFNKNADKRSGIPMGPFIAFGVWFIMQNYMIARPFI